MKTMVITRYCSTNDIGNNERDEGDDGDDVVSDMG